MTYRLRAAVEADLDAVAAIVYEGMDGYREFAAAGWAPPPEAEERQGLYERQQNPRAWSLVGEAEGGAVAGHVGFMPATETRRGSDDGTLAHLYHLFIARPHWGTGLAATLLARAVAEASARGFAAMRLITPAGQARARRFYEREGWRQSTEPAFEPHLGLEMVEYRIRL